MLIISIILDTIALACFTSSSYIYIVKHIFTSPLNWVFEVSKLIGSWHTIRTTFLGTSLTYWKLRTEHLHTLSCTKFRTECVSDKRHTCKSLYAIYNVWMTKWFDLAFYKEPASLKSLEISFNPTNLFICCMHFLTAYRLVTHTHTHTHTHCNSCVHAKIYSLAALTSLWTTTSYLYG